METYLQHSQNLDLSSIFRLLGEVGRDCWGNVGRGREGTPPTYKNKLFVRKKCLQPIKIHLVVSKNAPNL